LLNKFIKKVNFLLIFCMYRCRRGDLNWG